MSNTEQSSFDRMTETMGNAARWYRAICMFSVPFLLLLDGEPADGGERLFGSERWPMACGSLLAGDTCGLRSSIFSPWRLSRLC